MFCNVPSLVSWGVTTSNDTIIHIHFTFHTIKLFKYHNPLDKYSNTQSEFTYSS